MIVYLLVAVLVTQSTPIKNGEVSGKENLKEAQQNALLESLRDRVISREQELLKGEELVKFVNEKQKFWTAELHELFSSYDGKVKSGIMGVNYITLPTSARKVLSSTRHLNISLPHSFDAREWWPECVDVISEIRDQSVCGSCWAMAAAEAFSDRICIMSKGKLNVEISAGDLMSCCESCGQGCQGGYPIKAWEYFTTAGVVTGAGYQSTVGCKPYPFPPCHENTTEPQPEECKNGLFKTPTCTHKCRKQYGKQYNRDKLYAISAYGIDDDEVAIRKELMTYGPIEVAFEVYEDFLHYKNGVYVHVGGELLGGHAVKLIGWGEEAGLPYWLLSNSWGGDWGDRGVFKVVRGIDEVEIESGCVAGIPKILPKMESTN